MFICEISIVINLICGNLGSGGPIQQGIKLLSYFCLIAVWRKIFNYVSKLFESDDKKNIKHETSLS